MIMKLSETQFLEFIKCVPHIIEILLTAGLGNGINFSGMNLKHQLFDIS